MSEEDEYVARHQQLNKVAIDAGQEEGEKKFYAYLQKHHRIPMLLSRLGKAWEKRPEMRLAELISKPYGLSWDLSDEALISAIEKLTVGEK